MENLYILIIFLVIGTIAPRILLAVVPKMVISVPSRKKLGIKVHHLHYGILLLLASYLFTTPTEQLFYMIQGFGLGLILDVFIPSLYVNSTRKEEMISYRKYLIHTLVFTLIFSASVLFTQF